MSFVTKPSWKETTATTTTTATASTTTTTTTKATNTNDSINKGTNDGKIRHFISVIRYARVGTESRHQAAVDQSFAVGCFFWCQYERKGDMTKTEIDHRCCWRLTIYPACASVALPLCTSMPLLIHEAGLEAGSIAQVPPPPPHPASPSALPPTMSFRFI